MSTNTNPKAGTGAWDPAVSGAAWVAPQPQAVLGMSSSMVYGSAFAGTAPLSFQLAGGGLLKLIVDPVGFWQAFAAGPAPTWANAIFGSGSLGSSQITLGTSANLVMGQSYDIVVGPPKVTIDYSNLGMQAVTQALGIVMLAAAIAFMIAYDLITEDDKRANFVMVFQCVVQAALGIIMVYQNNVDLVNRETRKGIYEALATKDHYVLEEPASVAARVCPFVGPTEVLLAAIIPPIVDTIGEKKLDALVQGQQPEHGAYVSVSLTNMPS